MDNMKFYSQLANPPAEAIKPIQGGNLKGKSDINPQWKIEAMTSVFGPCGIGWKFNIADEKTFQCGDGQILLFLTVALMYHDGEGWSEPVYGCGGDFIVEKNKNGLVPNDEAYKMCLTDALGNAMKCIGVAADVYRGLWDSKYGESHRTEPQASRQTKAAAKHTDKVSSYQLAQLQTMAFSKQRSWTATMVKLFILSSPALTFSWVMNRAWRMYRYINTLFANAIHSRRMLLILM